MANSPRQPCIAEKKKGERLVWREGGEGERGGGGWGLNGEGGKREGGKEEGNGKLESEGV